MADDEKLIDHTVDGQTLQLKLLKDAWGALYGEGYDLQAGISGWGDTPEEALQDFDRAWRQERGK